MKKIPVIAIFYLLGAANSYAQGEFHRFEISGGMNLVMPDYWASLWGYSLGVQYNVNRTFSVVGEWTAAYNSIEPIMTLPPEGDAFNIPGRYSRFKTLASGPRFSYRTKHFTAFGHGLLGGANTGYEDNSGGAGEQWVYQWKIAMIFGGGIDVNLRNSIAIRAAQFDWVTYREDGGWDSHDYFEDYIRFQAGIVFKF